MNISKKSTYRIYLSIQKSNYIYKNRQSIYFIDKKINDPVLEVTGKVFL